MDTRDAWAARGRDHLLLGRRIFGLDTGGQAEPILLLHGFPTSSADYRHIVDALAAEHRVLTMDFLGFGLSEKPDVAYSLTDQADLVEAFVADVGLARAEVVLVTHDMGDSVGGELLARDLDGALSFGVSRRLLSNGSIYIEDASLRIGQRLLLAIGDRRLSFPFAEQIARNGLTEVFGPDTKPGQAELDLQWSLMSHDAGQSVLPRIMRYIPERHATQHRWTGAIERHPSPLHILWGEEDPVALVSMARRLHDAVPDATLTILEGIGHFPMIESPARFAEAVLREPGDDQAW